MCWFLLLELRTQANESKKILANCQSELWKEMNEPKRSLGPGQTTMPALNGQYRCWPADEAERMMPMPIFGWTLDRSAAFPTDIVFDST